MDRLADWLKREFRMERVVFVEKQSHGHFLHGSVQDRNAEFLVVASGHVWTKRPHERSWRTTGIYVPDRVLF